MTICAEPDGLALRITISGRFEFNAHPTFRTAFECGAKSFERYELDLRKTVYLVNAALGMLLLLRDHAGGDAARIRIVNCSPEVRRILGIANSHKLFEIV